MLPKNTNNYHPQTRGLSFFHTFMSTEEVKVPYPSLAVADTGGDVVPAPFGLLTFA